MSDVRNDVTQTSRLALLLRNAGANLVRAVATSAMTVLLPLILVVVFDVDHYAAWALVFSIGAYVVYLDLGIPTTIQAMVGRALAVGDRRGARSVTRSGLIVVGTVSALCLAAAFVVASRFAEFFPDAPAALAGQAAVALPAIVIGQVSVLIGNVAAAYFGGQQRSHVSMFVLTPARLICMVSAVLVALATGDLGATAWGFAVPLVAGSAVLVALYLGDSRNRHDEHTGLSERTGVVAVLASSGPLIVWGLCALVTTGIGVAIVGRLDYGAVVVYSLATVFVSALAGAQSSVTTPWLPEFGRYYAVSGVKAVSTRVAQLSTVNAVFLMAVSTVLISAAPWVLPLLTRRDPAALTFDWTVFAVLLVGNAIHLVATPVTLGFIATRSHTKIIAPPIIEAVVSLALSLLLAQWAGAVGVAVAAFVASSVGVVLCFTWSMRLSGALQIPRGELFRHSLLVPLASLIPTVVSVGAVLALGLTASWIGPLAVTAGCGLTLWLLVRYALPKTVRERIVSRLRRRRNGVRSGDA